MRAELPKKELEGAPGIYNLLTNCNLGRGIYAHAQILMWALPDRAGCNWGEKKTRLLEESFGCVQAVCDKRRINNLIRCAVDGRKRNWSEFFQQLHVLLSRRRRTLALQKISELQTGFETPFWHVLSAASKLGQLQRTPKGRPRAALLLALCSETLALADSSYARLSDSVRKVDLSREDVLIVENAVQRRKRIDVTRI